MKLKDIGEYKLVSHVTGWINKNIRNNKNLIVPPGDDAAVLNFKAGCLVCTTDVLIEGVHFKTEWAKTLGRDKLFEALGYKSLAINMSDISAMGSSLKPVYCLIGIGLPSYLKLDDLKHFYKGMQSFSEIAPVKIIGGDTNSSDKLFISVTLFSEIEKKHIIRRAGANINDFIYVTGFLGDSGAGLKILENRGNSKKITPRDKNYLITKHLFPPFRLRDIYNFRSNITSMIDCSDGLANSIELLCAASRKSALLFEDNIPVSVELKKFCKFNKQTSVEMALYGGEDYELIFTSPLKFDRFKCIGRITTGNFQNISILKNGKKHKINKNKKFEHFAG